LTSPLADISGDVREVTVLMTDLRGFTAMAGSLARREMLALLNRYLARMCEIAAANGGNVDKFLGDAVMVVFGAPRRLAHHARQAVTCAAQMQLAMNALNRANSKLGLPPLYMGIGINSGRVFAGTLGSEVHAEYTVIGDDVNLASRIESFSLRGQVLISEATYARCGRFVAAGGPMDVRVKGKPKPLRVRDVRGIPSLGLEVPARSKRKSPRVEGKLPFTYQKVVDNIVLPKVHKGTIRDIGYGGLLAEVRHGLKEHTDMVMQFDLPLIGRHEREIYGMVRHSRHHRGRRLAGIEFTSVRTRAEQDIRYFVQMLIQGSPKK